jgi:hypothetical protein
MIRIVCDKCGKDISMDHYKILLRNFADLGMTDAWRVREISNEMRDGLPEKDKQPATDKEKDVVRQLGHELTALMLYSPIICHECVKTNVITWDPSSGEPLPFLLSPEERRAAFRLLPGGVTSKKDE